MPDQIAGIHAYQRMWSTLFHHNQIPGACYIKSWSLLNARHKMTVLLTRLRPRMANESRPVLLQRATRARAFNPDILVFEGPT